MKTRHICRSGSYVERLRFRRSSSSVRVIAEPQRGQCRVMFQVGRRSRVAQTNAAAPIGLEDGNSLRPVGAGNTSLLVTALS
jgi:hypothetical protein